MLDYQVIGPDANGEYSVGYPTPGAPHVMSICGAGISKACAEQECERLNESQVAGQRQAIRDRADRIVNDLPRDERGRPHGR